jgi:hypothetical protein
LKKLFSVNRILWAIYLSLLGMLLHHTAWAFHNFEPENESGKISLVAWTAAFAFEASIAALMHKLSGHIDRTPRRLSAWAKFRYRYLNAYSLGLLAAIAVSSLANLAHAVEFGRPMAIFAEWKISFDVYAFAFGAVLPLVSLVFVRVLSNVVEIEGDEDPALVEAQNTIADMRRQLRESEAQRKAAEEERQQAEDRYISAAGTLVKIVSADKRERILAAHRLWPRLPGAALSIIADASPSYVSEVLKADTDTDTLAGELG